MSDNLNHYVCDSSFDLLCTSHYLGQKVLEPQIMYITSHIIILLWLLFFIYFLYNISDVDVEPFNLPLCVR